jgi:hypothetical protein
VSRRVVRHAVALACALAALVPAVAAPAAHAESLSISSGSDPAAGVPNGVDYLYDTGSVPLNLVIIARPASGPPCRPTSTIDAAEVGQEGTTYLTPTPIRLEGIGGDRVPYTYPAAGSYRVCSWLYRTPDDVAAVSSFSVDVRRIAAEVQLTASQLAPKAGGSDILLRLTGTTETAQDLLALVLPGGSPCPATYDPEAAQTVFDVSPSGTPTRVTGRFDATFQTRDLVSYRRWRLCAYLQDGSEAPAPAAAASTLIDMVVKPQLLRRPRARRQGGGLRCDGGLWRARPAATYTYTWLAGGRTIASGRALPAAKAKGRAAACRVTAKNRLGSTTATSRPVRARA